MGDKKQIEFTPQALVNIADRFQFHAGWHRVSSASYWQHIQFYLPYTQSSNLNSAAHISQAHLESVSSHKKKNKYANVLWQNYVSCWHGGCKQWGLSQPHKIFFHFSSACTIQFGSWRTADLRFRGWVSAVKWLLISFPSATQTRLNVTSEKPSAHHRAVVSFTYLPGRVNEGKEYLK